MRKDEKDKAALKEPQLQSGVEATRTSSHIVFDFTGLDRPDVSDLALILTARLQSAPTDNVWVRSLPWQTARVLRALRLDHLFREYPTAPDEIN